MDIVGTQINCKKIDDYAQILDFDQKIFLTYRISHIGGITGYAPVF